MLALSYFTEFTALLGLLFLLLYFYFVRNFDYWKNKNVPYLKPSPFFGNLFDAMTMRATLGEALHRIYNQSKEPFVGFFILDKPYLLLRDPNLIKRILVTDFQYFFDRITMSNKRDDPISAHILFNLKNPDWKEIRAKITPVFTSSKIKTMSKLMEESGKELVSYLGEIVKRNNVVELKELCSKFTVDVISSAAFGVNANCFKDENSQFKRVAKKILDWDDFSAAFQMRCYFLAHTLVKLFRMRFFNRECTNFLKDSFLDIMDRRQKSNTTRNDLIDILLQIKKQDNTFIEGDILVSQAVMFFTAGYETSSTLMSFALYEIAHHPEVQNKLKEEILEVSNKHGGITYEAIKEMVYLDMCAKEALRKYPPLPFLDRVCINDYKIPETDVTIDKGTPILIPLLGLHHDPEYFPDPEKFIPERFSKDSGHVVDNSTFLPFGTGPRNCIGDRFGSLSARMGLAHILRDFTVKPCEETQKDMKFQPNGIILSALGGITLNIERTGK